MSSGTDRSRRHATHAPFGRLSAPAQTRTAQRGECVAVAQLSASHPEVATAIAFTERFTAIVRERRGEELGTWLADAATSGLRELRQFALKMRKDEDAVTAGCTLSWSNGQTEGQINRLKLLKRQMYGRAKFDLLRQRILEAA